MAENPVVLSKWAETYKDQFVPPICAKLMYGREEGELKVMFVGGPNERKDYHIELGEELFYMVKGNMRLPIMEHGKPKDVHIRQGQFFLLPARIPHSPQRPEVGSLGLVVERDRSVDEIDCLRYFVDGSDNQALLWEDWFHCACLESLGDVVKKFKQSEQFQTGKPAEDFKSSPHFEVDTTTTVQDPFYFEDWLKEHASALSSGKTIPLFQAPEMQVNVFSNTTVELISGEHELLFWQYKGNSKCTREQETTDYEDGTMLLLKPNQTAKIEFPTRKTLPLAVDGTNTSFELKQKIIQSLGNDLEKSFSPNQLILSFSGELLVDSEQLRHYNIQQDSTILAFIQLTHFAWFGGATHWCESCSRATPGSEDDCPIVQNLKKAEHLRLLASQRPVFTESYTFKSEFGREGRAPGTLGQPWGIAIEPLTGLIFVAETCFNSRISVFQPDGTFVRILGSEGEEDGQYRGPCGLVFDHSGNLVVGDGQNRRVQIVDPCTGKLKLKFGKFGDFFPQDVTIDNEGNIVICDSSNQCIQIFTEKGIFLRKFATNGQGSDVGQLHSPLRVAVSPLSGNFVVSEKTNNRVQIFNPQGEPLKVIGGAGKALLPCEQEGPPDDGQFSEPFGLVVDAQDHILVVDRFHGRLQWFSPDGQFLRKLKPQGRKNGEMSWPAAVAINKDGEIFVVDHNTINTFSPVVV